MTDLQPKDLLTAGFKFSRQTTHVPFPCDLYQKRYRDEHGTRYFVNVWHHDELVLNNGTTHPRSFEVDICYNDGCTFHPRAAVAIKAYTCNKWTVADIERYADEMWQRLCPNYYERHCDANLPAGRELDGAVAKVLGKHVHWKHGHPFSDEIGLMGFNSIARYSTDPADAIEALEAWAKGDVYRRYEIHFGYGEYYVILRNMDGRFIQDAPTLAHAAALALVATKESA